MPSSVVFMGTAEGSAEILRALLDAPALKVVGVVTPPDRPRGRGRKLAPCDVKLLAQEAGLPVCDPERVNDPEVLQMASRWAPDLVVVAAFGQFLGRRWLALPPLGCLNVHLSLLPALRGAAPVQWAILNGEHETGVTVMKMDRGMDSGDILAQRKLAIGPEESAGALERRLVILGARLLVEILPAWRDGRIVPRPQNSACATLAPKLKKSDGWINWSLPAPVLARRVRAFNPWPGCATRFPGAGKAPPHRLVISRASSEKVCPGIPPRVPGTLCRADEDGLLVTCGDGCLRMLEIRPEGRQTMSAPEYLRGRPLRPGMVLG